MGPLKYIYISSDLIHIKGKRKLVFLFRWEKMPLVRDDYAPMDIEELHHFL